MIVACACLCSGEPASSVTGSSARRSAAATRSPSCTAARPSPRTSHRRCRRRRRYAHPHRPGGLRRHRSAGRRTAPGRGHRHLCDDPGRRGLRAAASARCSDHPAVQHGCVPGLRTAARRRGRATGADHRGRGPARRARTRCAGTSKATTTTTSSMSNPPISHEAGRYCAWRRSTASGIGSVARSSSCAGSAPGGSGSRWAPGTWLWTRAYVADVASAVLAALDAPAVAAGQVFNVGELVTDTMREHAQRILRSAECDAELVTVPDEDVPAGPGGDAKRRAALPL